MQTFNAIRSAIERTFGAGVGPAPIPASRATANVRDPRRGSPRQIHRDVRGVLDERGVHRVPVRVLLECLRCWSCGWVGTNDGNRVCPRCDVDLVLPADSTVIVRLRMRHWFSD
jgi:hypothetical protein